jgi:hypothetical protein
VGEPIRIVGGNDLFSDGPSMINVDPAVGIGYVAKSRCGQHGGAHIPIRAVLAPYAVHASRIPRDGDTGQAA